ncbi:MAG: hypothetical protein H6865_01080 [Rhodospirillales bacterium]|nr:hypothetical protein [Rhodospirillales bacterium]USO07225.1 MAG: hypothetical protein H6866_07290 [Rhodospirillales bacterium]
MVMQRPWPQAHKDRLAELADGTRGSVEIADVLNRAFKTAYTPKAVIGRVHRENEGRKKREKSFLNCQPGVPERLLIAHWKKTAPPSLKVGVVATISPGLSA